MRYIAQLSELCAKCAARDSTALAVHMHSSSGDRFRGPKTVFEVRSPFTEKREG